jgi:UDP-N-acetylglucosamine 2-epimerase (non-hydrolysing)
VSGARKVLLVYGTRPEAIKVAPLVTALEQADGLVPVVAVTGQHREMLDQVNELFGIEPAHDLNIIQPRQTLVDVTVRSLEGVTRIIQEERPDAVVVQGDTTTSTVAALAAAYEKVPVVHLEAGLRTHERYNPFPEEINRRVTGQLTSVHLAPTATSRANLLREGATEGEVAVTGNTVIDALLSVVGADAALQSDELRHLNDDPRQVLLVTTHRRESWGAPMAEVARAVADVARELPDLLVVLPLHRNPVVREAVLPAVEDLPNVLLTEPLEYAEFARLMNRAHVVLTDSGGVQEEAPSLGKPVLVIRENTERPEAVEAGTVRLVGTDRATVRDAVLELFRDPAAHAAMANAVNPYGDGRASERCVAAIRHFFGEGERAPDFAP